MNNNPVQPGASASPINTSIVQSETSVPYKDLPMGALADEITRISVDGRPAHPEMGPRRIRRLVVSLVGVVLIVGVLVALLVDRTVGLGMAAFGVLLFVVNPEFWATVFRARERRRAQRHVERAIRFRRVARRWGRTGKAKVDPQDESPRCEGTPSRWNETTPPGSDWGIFRAATRRGGDEDDGVSVKKAPTP